MSRRSLRWWCSLTGVVIVNTVLELSASVGRWWGESGSANGLPRVVRDVVESRPETGEGDVHLVMWFAAGALLVLAVRRWRSRIVGLVALWLYSGVLELLQPFVGRDGRWSDFAANALGVCAAAAGVLLGEWYAQRRRPHWV